MSHVPGAVASFSSSGSSGSAPRFKRGTALGGTQAEPSLRASSRGNLVDGSPRVTSLFREQIVVKVPVVRGGSKMRVLRFEFVNKNDPQRRYL